MAAGKLALLAYEQSRRGSTHGSSLAIPAAGAAAECVGTTGQKQGLAEVANGIFDFTAGGPVQAGIVAVKATRANAFEMSPFTEAARVTNGYAGLVNVPAAPGARNPPDP